MFGILEDKGLVICKTVVITLRKEKEKRKRKLEAILWLSLE